MGKREKDKRTDNFLHSSNQVYSCNSKNFNFYVQRIVRFISSSVPSQDPD